MRYAKTLLTLTLLAPLVRGIDPPAIARVSDAELTRRVQTVLTTDSVLKGRSLIVSVVDGVAVVGGPVATTEESARISQLLRVVPDLTDVKVSAWVPAIEDPLKRKIAERLRGQEPIAQTNRVSAADPRPSARVVVQRFAPTLPTVPLLQDPVVQRDTPLPTRGNSSAYSPIPAPAPPAPEGPPQFPTIPPPAVPVTPKQDVESAIDEVKRGQSRFAGLTVGVRTGVVTIDGTTKDAEDGWDFAALVRKVPGVERVVLGRITTP